MVLGAVWSKCGKLVLSWGTFGDGREWATQVHESEGGNNEATVEAWDISALLQLGGGCWLPKVRNICIELHGADCREVFLGALQRFEYNLEFSGELTICRNLRHKTTSAQPVPDR